MNTIQRVLLARLGSDIIKKTGHPRHCCPPFTLKYIQALLLQDSYEVRLIDCMVKSVPFPQLIENSLSWMPELIVAKADFLCYKNVIKYAQEIKKIKNVFIVLIIQGIKLIDEKLDCLFDLILSGEVEQQVVYLIKMINQGKSAEEVKASYFKKRKALFLIDKLDTLPFPVNKLSELEKYGLIYPLKINQKVVWGHILSSRGCSHKCIFCSSLTRYSFGRKIRLRDSANVVEEIQYLIKQGANVISFDDDDFTASSEHIISICKEIKKRHLHIPWIAHARIDEVDIELLKNMHQAGCVLLRLGVESGSDKILRKLQKNDSHIDWIKQAKFVFKAARKLNIATLALFIIGNPSETKDDFQASIQLAENLDPDMIQVHFFTPYPDSIAYRNFRLKLDLNKNEMYHYANPQIELSDFDINSLIKMRAFFYRKVLFKPKFIFRHLKDYLIFYLHNLKVFKNLIKIWHIL